MANYHKMTNAHLRWLIRMSPEQSQQAIAANGELARRTLKPKKRKAKKRPRKRHSKIWPDHAGYRELAKGLSSVLRRNAEL